MARVTRSRRDGRGSTLIEVLVATTLLGIVMVPLGMATSTAWRTVFGIQQKLSSSADAQLLAATFPADVQSAGATGVNPTDPVNVNTCAARAEDGETPLIMFVWDEDLGVSNQSVARYLAKGSGADSMIIRRFCKGTDAAQDIVVARNFGLEGIKEASLFTLGDNGLTSPQCTATSCLIKITGEYNFQLDVDRRVPGSAPGAYVPDAPTNVHALGGNNRATVYWTDPSDNGAAITGYYLEQSPGGTVLGPFSTNGVTGASVSGLTNGQSYTFRVRAANVLGPGPYSIPTGARDAGSEQPGRPDDRYRDRRPRRERPGDDHLDSPVGLRQRWGPGHRLQGLRPARAGRADRARCRQPGRDERSRHRPLGQHDVRLRDLGSQRVRRGLAVGRIRRRAHAPRQARNADGNVHGYTELGGRHVRPADEW